MRVYDADIIAKYFLSRTDADIGDLISNLKLQKLCYYAAGVFAAARDNDDFPLFREQIEAWQHGPVVPAIYHTYKAHGSNGIPSPEGFDIDDIEPHDRAVLDDVYNYYGQYSAWKLRNMTHDESPWLQASEQETKVIGTPALRAFFSSEFEAEYFESYRKQLVA